MTDAQFLAAILEAYRFSQQAIDDMAEAIATARLLSMEATYRHAQRVIGVPANWIPTKQARKYAERQSKKDARGIAQTFKDLLKSFLEKTLDVKKDWHDIAGTIADAVSRVAGYVREWIKDLLPWKSKQIVNVTCGAGLNDGTMQFVQDVLDAQQSGDNMVEGDNGETIIDFDVMSLDVDQIGVLITPENSSSDFCKNYAGKQYSLQEYCDLSVMFPAHTNCIHYPIAIQI